MCVNYTWPVCHVCQPAGAKVLSLYCITTYMSTCDYVKFITSCSSWIIEIRLVAWCPGVTNKMEFVDGHRSRSRPGRTSMKEPYYFTIYVYM